MCYDVHTFVDKNRDQVPVDALRFVVNSEIPFVSKELFGDISSDELGTKESGPSKKKRISVSSTFKNQV